MSLSQIQDSSCLVEFQRNPHVPVAWAWNPHFELGNPEKYGKILGKSLENMENHGKIMGNCRILGKSWEHQEKIRGKSWQNMEKWREILYHEGLVRWENHLAMETFHCHVWLLERIFLGGLKMNGPPKTVSKSKYMIKKYVYERFLKQHRKVAYRCKTVGFHCFIGVGWDEHEFYKAFWCSPKYQEVILIEKNEKIWHSKNWSVFMG